MNQIIPFKKDIIFKTKISDITSISLEHKYEMKDKIAFIEFNISGEYKMTETSINNEKFDYNLPFELDIDNKYDIKDMKIDIDDFYYEIVNNEILRINISILLENLNLAKTDKEILEEFSRNDSKSILDIEDNYNKELETYEEKVNENIEIPDNTIDNNIENTNENKELSESNDKNIDVSEVVEDITNERNDSIMEDTMLVKDANEENNINDKIINGLFSNINSEETFKTYHVYIMRDGDTIENILTKYKVTKEMIEEYNNITNVKVGDKIIIPCCE